MSLHIGAFQLFDGRFGSHESAPALVSPDREAMGAEQLALLILARAPFQTVRFGLGFGFDLAAFLSPAARAEGD